MAVGGGLAQVLSVVNPGPRPCHLNRQRDGPGAEDGNEQRTDQVREDPGDDTLVDPGQGQLDGAARFAAVPPGGEQRGRHRPAEQQDPGEHHERIDLRSRQPRIGGVLAKSERGHRVHDQAEHDAHAGAGGQRGRGYPRPPRGHPEDDDHVAGREEDQRDLALPGRTARRRAGQVGRGVPGSIKDRKLRTSLRHGKRERRDDVDGRHQGQDRRVPADTQEPGRPAIADRSEEPACEQRQPGQQQHRGDHPELIRGGMTGRRVRPGGPGRHRRGRHEQHGTAGPVRQRLSHDQPHRARPPGQPRESWRHLVRFGPDRFGPVPPSARHQSSRW